MDTIISILNFIPVMQSMIDQTLEWILAHELNRQQNELELIASENYVSKDVLNAYANVFTNKYSEGYPGARYYGGQEYVDQLERVAQERALQLFLLDTSVWWVNVQAHSGSPANLAVYLWLLKPGDTVLAMDLNAWGHLSHGHKLNASAIYYHFVPYGVLPSTFDVDYDDIRSKALELKPAMIVAWFSAYPKSIDWERFAAIADEVSKVHGYRPILMADIAHIAGLIAGGVCSSPFPYFDIVTTTTHKTLRWPRGALIYSRAQYNKQVDRGVFPGVQWWPHEHTIFAKAVAFQEALQPSFAEYAKKIIENAKVLAEELVALGRNVLTGTTENHIVLVDVTKRIKNHELKIISSNDRMTEWQNDGIDTGLTWKIAEHTLEKIGISINKNTLPFDTRSPMDPSGIRLGTPAITTRGLWADEVRQVAWIISRALENHTNEEVLASLKNEVKILCEKFPLRY